ncbi:hypothetical protein [Pseudomonas sp. BMS12]|uniref:hypothetical protein n=1 Tax=Pseudomonas sp. BMS12 TaxID=1796033 RepID=UPI00083A1DD2|nr:hypothetical protein [Pseudomonas sp. BMS12]
MKREYFDTPEQLFVVRSDAQHGVPVDAINAACLRAEAVLLLLSGQFSGQAEYGRFADHVIFNALWDVQGTLEQVRTLVSFAAGTTTPKAEGEDQ